MSRKDPNKDSGQTTGVFSQWLQRLCPNHSDGKRKEVLIQFLYSSKSEKVQTQTYLGIKVKHISLSSTN